jgi:hypothetical protein
MTSGHSPAEASSVRLSKIRRCGRARGRSQRVRHNLTRFCADETGPKHRDKGRVVISTDGLRDGGVCLLAAKPGNLRGFQKVGGTGLEPVTPSLSTRCGRSRRFAGVRSRRMVQRNPKASGRFSERERCHCCHAAPDLFGWCSPTEGVTVGEAQRPSSCMAGRLLVRLSPCSGPRRQAWARP